MTEQVASGQATGNTILLRCPAKSATNQAHLRQKVLYLIKQNAKEVWTIKAQLWQSNLVASQVGKLRPIREGE